MFPNLKKHLGGITFSSNEQLKTAFDSSLYEAVREQYGVVMIRLPEGLQKCIDCDEDYVENSLKSNVSKSVIGFSMN